MCTCINNKPTTALDDHREDYLIKPGLALCQARFYKLQVFKEKAGF